MSDFLRSKRVSVHSVTIGRWVQKFVEMCIKYLADFRVLVGDRWHADEIWIKVLGERLYMFLTMDHKTRFCLSLDLGEKTDGHSAGALLRDAREHACKVLLDFVSDAPPSYSVTHEKNMPRGTPDSRAARTRAIYT